jgi:hypothetical protein
MKKLLIVIAFSFLTATTFAAPGKDSKDDVKKVSYTALRQFEENFKDAKDVSWKVTSLFVKASFTTEGKKMAALYDLQGEFLGAVEYLNYQELPLKARVEIEKRYKDFSFSSALKIVTRPSDNSDFNDVGTYWVDLTNDVKQLYISISPSLTVALHKSIAIAATARN